MAENAKTMNLNNEQPRTPYQPQTVDLWFVSVYVPLWKFFIFNFTIINVIVYFIYFVADCRNW